MDEYPTQRGWGKRMVHRVITLWLICYVLFAFFTLVFAILYDAWALWHNEETVTDIGRELSQKCPMLPWVWGLATGALASHFFWMR